MFGRLLNLGRPLSLVAIGLNLANIGIGSGIVFIGNGIVGIGSGMVFIGSGRGIGQVFIGLHPFGHVHVPCAPEVHNPSGEPIVEGNGLCAALQASMSLILLDSDVRASQMSLIWQEEGLDTESSSH
jgi:hypothetical protein